MFSPGHGTQLQLHSTENDTFDCQPGAEIFKRCHPLLCFLCMTTMGPLITISNHTTASSPRPHILYTVQITRNGIHSTVNKRYSEFATLHDKLGDPFELPPKRLLVTTFVPSAWLDDALIAERKTGLQQYLSDLLIFPEYQEHPDVLAFLSAAPPTEEGKFNPEDAVPSTMSRKAALDLLKSPDAEPGQGAPQQEPSADPPQEGTPSDIPQEGSPNPPQDPTSDVPQEPTLPTNPLPSGPAPDIPKTPDAGTEATMIAAAYYPDWSAGSFPPEKLDYSKFDILFFAFAMPNSSSTLTWDSGSQSILKRLVTSARNSGKGTKVVLSVGGWGGSHYFSAACSSSANRTKFVNALKSAVSTYQLDGIDIDWEYPNSTGAGNPHSPSDAANLLSLFKSLRSALGSSKIISAAVPHLPWLGSNGSPLKDVSAYAAQLTYVNIMNYDVWGASANPGPNAPLGNLCGTSKQPQASAQAGLAQWKAAKFPANKLLLGLPLYGYVSQSTKKALTGSLMPSSDMVLLQREEFQVDGQTDMNFLNGAHARPKELKTAAANANLQSWWNQQIPFSAIVKSGALVKRSDGNYGEGGGFTMAWDDCSDTPFLFNVSQRTVVTYDDTWSLADKAKFAKQNGMAGCFTWSLDQDDGVTLQNVIRKNLGK